MLRMQCSCSMHVECTGCLMTSSTYHWVCEIEKFIIDIHIDIFKIYSPRVCIALQQACSSSFLCRRGPIGSIETKNEVNIFFFLIIKLALFWPKTPVKGFLSEGGVWPSNNQHSLVPPHYVANTISGWFGLGTLISLHCTVLLLLNKDSLERLWCQIPETFSSDNEYLGCCKMVC